MPRFLLGGQGTALDPADGPGFFASCLRDILSSPESPSACAGPALVYSIFVPAFASLVLYHHLASVVGVFLAGVMVAAMALGGGTERRAVLAHAGVVAACAAGPAASFPLYPSQVVLVALGALLVLALIGGAIKGNLPQLLPSIAVILLFLALASGGASWLAAWQFRRNNPNVVSGFHYDLSAAGFRTQCGSVDSTVAWPGLMRIVETGDFFLAYLAKNAAHYIPKRVLTDNDMRTLRRLLREHVPEKMVLAV